MNRQRLLLLAGIAISAVALVLVALSIDLGATADVLRAADLRPLLVVPLLVALQLAIRTFRWVALSRVATGHQSVPFVPTLRALLIGYLANVVLPARLGEIVRSGLLARRLGVSVEPILGTVVVERVLDVATLGLVAVAAVGLTVGLSSPLGAAAIGAAILALGVILALVFGSRWLAPRVRPEATKEGILGRAIGVFARLVTALARIPTRLLALSAGISLAAWVVEGLSFLLISRSVGLDITYPAALVFASATVLGTALPAAPGYVGVFEATGVAAGIALGIDPASALALTLVAHLVLVGTAALGGAAALMVEGSREALQGPT